MKSLILFIIFNMLVITAAQAQVYRWVNEQGAVVYSDTPHHGAEEIQLLEADTIKNDAPDFNPAQVFQESKKIVEPTNYEEIAIAAPVNDSTVRNVNSVTVTISSTPALRGGDEVIFSFGDQTIRSASSSHTFNNVVRGSQSISAYIENAQGIVVSETANAVVHVQKTHIRRN